jgi:hypothetical protein
MITYREMKNNRYNFWYFGKIDLNKQLDKNQQNDIQFLTESQLLKN